MNLLTETLHILQLYLIVNLILSIAIIGFGIVFIIKKIKQFYHSKVNSLFDEIDEL